MICCATGSSFWAMELIAVFLQPPSTDFLPGSGKNDPVSDTRGDEQNS